MSEIPPMEPRFLPGPDGPLMSVLHRPRAQVAGSIILHVPAFADEMNKSRHVVAAAARGFAQAGAAVLLLDPRGTGDSHGEFGESSWEAWVEDVRFGVAWLHQQGWERVALWGLRTGCLLVDEVVARGERPVWTLYWQPVIRGNVFLRQYLRLEAMSLKMKGEGQGGEERPALQRLQAGESVEVAGYTLAPELALPLGEAELRAPPAAHEGKSVAWLEVAAASGTLSPIAANTSSAWREGGVNVAAEAVSGEPFWSTQELAHAPALVEASVAAARVAGLLPVAA